MTSIHSQVFISFTTLISITKAKENLKLKLKLKNSIKVLKFNIMREGPKTIKYTRDTSFIISSRENKTKPVNAESLNLV